MCRDSNLFCMILGFASLFYILCRGGEWMDHGVYIRDIVLLFPLCLVWIFHFRQMQLIFRVPLFFFLIASIISMIVALCWWISLLCSWSNNHCCFITVDSPTVSIGLLHGRYMLKIVVLLLFLPRIVMKAHLPNPDGSFPLLIVAEVILFNDIIAVPPGL